MKIYTKTGDSGETSLIGNVRVAKDHLRVEAYGVLDETTSTMGLARSIAVAERTKEILLAVQEQLVHVSAEIASATEDIVTKLKNRILATDLTAMEEHIDWLQERKLAGKGWVIPGLCPSGAALDVARTTSRRAERLLIKLNREAPLRSEVIQYVNRLSDLLFALARYEEREFVIQQVRDGVKRELGVNEPAPLELDLDAARSIAAEALTKAASLGIPVVVAILDHTGTLLLLERQMGSLPVSVQLAQDKAYTAFSVRTATHELNSLIQPGQPLYGLQHVHTMPLTMVGGGFPLVQGTRVIGAMGISGGSVADDVEIGKEALAKVAKLFAAGQPAANKR